MALSQLVVPPLGPSPFFSARRMPTPPSRANLRNGGSSFCSRNGTRLSCSVRVALDPESHNAVSTNRPLISFPGGGVFFYWQMGAISAIRKRHDLKDVDFSGASAGALSATLAACQVDAMEAAELAFRLSIENNVWDRTTGLGGIWGRLIREWLQVLLPENCAEICSGKVHIYVLHLPSISRRKWNFVREPVNEFQSKDDLIECCMSSVHVPFFMDGKFSTRFRGIRTVDGSFLASRESISLGGNRPTLYLDYINDEEMKKKRFQFLSLGSEGEGPSKSWQWLNTMMEQGEKYVERMNEQGKLHFLESNKNHSTSSSNHS